MFLPRSGMVVFPLSFVCGRPPFMRIEAAQPATESIAGGAHA